ncbi:MAG: hypothetical protein LC737_00360 [Chloroflexi bacterium]|nr:hypothetical protein [Chloroflexota bacterium]
MLDPYSDVSVQNSRQRYREILAEIEQERMFEDPEARGADAHKRVLFGMGNVFVALGRRLQQLSRFDPSATARSRQAW